MSVKYTATWTCDGCKAVKVVNDSFTMPPPRWILVAITAVTTVRHYCAKCAKEKGL